MKTFLIGTAFIITLASFGSAAYANPDNSGSKEGCRATPISEPSGGASRQRLANEQKCHAGVAEDRQSTETSNAKGCKVPIARPSGGATRERLAALQKCYSGAQ
ncbi:MAG: hypothetical protein CLLPBCKN_004087 [Chroococcidiopsis cubana SAG 39.79]|uniref:Phosphate starvation-inducible protein PsiF n=1 Tax=Chroococcidiopsis cubana SAG 39.79 TaxID=388085 RepID=A0AB37URY2_9CYAN|nr:hypothetical protein [Chroococcidiopsis cubana]MDZ4874691.1 hypothetical protein [Chroococcidiopsis cubana SAG 39.79]PSB53603.1 hypothetical protein C7B79_35445 [Chroococcidiopsis cubana CCALA 043]RUT14218.1 hypothetical protein DSM107010_07010 [Chroococcidiopsis cubana SAG 39.79]